MAAKCTNCGGSHPRWECTKHLKESAVTGKTIVRDSLAQFANADKQAKPADAVHSDLRVTGDRIRRRVPLAADTYIPEPFDRLKYQREYMRDKAIIKRLGLSVTVKQYRESLK